MALVSARAARRPAGRPFAHPARPGGTPATHVAAPGGTPAGRPPAGPGAPGPASRERRPARAGRALAVVGLALAGIVAAGGGAAAMGVPWSTAGWGGDRLTVTYDDGSGHPTTRTLVCGRRDVRRAEEEDACRRLEELGGPLAPAPAGQMCSMIYGGPQTAHVSGMWHGEPVDETYRRTDGCEVARWNRMVPVLPSPAAGGGGPHSLAA